MSETQALSIATIRIDGGTQPRAIISTAAVGDYAEVMRDGKPLPAVDVFFDGAEYWLADGFHRYHAIKRLDRQFITATVHAGTKREAVLFSVGANHGHGLQRTNADKRKAVMTLIADEEWRQWTTVSIARACGVSEELVAVVRKSYLPETDSEKTAPKKYLKHGTEATMHVENIGRPGPRKGQKLPDKSQKAVKQRREQIRAMAADGYRISQIAATLEISEEGCRRIIQTEGIVLPADRVTGNTRRLDANRIVEHVVMDADNLTADTIGLIDFGQLDPAKLPAWIATLHTAANALEAFIRRLKKEQHKHEAA